MATVFFNSASELATVRNIFKVNAVATDPTTISLTVTTPAQVSTTYTYAAAQITRNGTGDYQKDIACSEAGEWEYVWTGTGAAADVQAGTWTVFETSLGKLYGTVDALKSVGRLNITGTTHDYELHSACFAASRWVEQYCERVFYRTATGTARTFIPDDYYCLRLPEFNDLVSVASLKTDSSGDGTFETTWATTDYQLHPVNPSAAPEQRPYTKVKAVGAQTFPLPSAVLARDDRVEVTGVFGWPAVPMAVKQAALLKAAKIFRRKDSPEGVADFGEAGLIRVRAEDPDVAALLGPYRRYAAMVR